MQTVVDNLQKVSDEIRDMLQDFLLNHSSIYRWNQPDGPVVVIAAYGSYAYRELNDVGRQLQAKLLEEYRRLYAILAILFKEQPKDSLRLLSESDSLISRAIEQQETWFKTTQEAFAKVKDALQTQLDLLKRLYDPSTGEAIYVPDTNALLYNPTLETWTIRDIPSFTIIFLPTVLSELDALKINHRNEAVRQKAETLIRQIKEYRRRGRLTEGIPLVKGISKVLAIATEPDMEAPLPWLDSQNNDDRFLAATIEVMRSRPRSQVTLVSRDINLQNKAEFAHVPFIEPPEPIS